MGSILLIPQFSILQTGYNYSLHGGWALWLPYLVSGLMIGAVWCQALYYERCWGGQKRGVSAIQEGLLRADEGGEGAAAGSRGGVGRGAEKTGD